MLPDGFAGGLVEGIEHAVGLLGAGDVEVDEVGQAVLADGGGGEGAAAVVVVLVDIVGIAGPEEFAGEGVELDHLAVAVLAAQVEFVGGVEGDEAGGLDFEGQGSVDIVLGVEGPDGLEGVQVDALDDADIGGEVDVVVVDHDGVLGADLAVDGLLVDVAVDLGIDGDGGTE